MNQTGTKPVNDVVLVRIDQEYGDFVSSVEQEGNIIGTLIDVSDDIMFLSSFSYVLEQSFMNKQKLDEIINYWKSQIGKKIRWEERADRGTTFEHNGKKYAFIKITKILGIVEEQTDGTN